MRELPHLLPRRSAGARFLPLALCTGLLASAPGHAQDYPARDVAGWTIAASKDKTGCFLSRTYAGSGGTTLLLGLDADGANHLSVLNANWSIKPKERLKLNFRLSAGGYSDQAVVGMASEGKRGFVTTFEAKFPAYFASSKALHIYRGDVPVEQLDLGGSGAAVAELRRCVGLFATRPAAGSRSGAARGRNIPRDPFATQSND